MRTLSIIEKGNGYNKRRKYNCKVSIVEYNKVHLKKLREIVNKILENYLKVKGKNVKIKLRIRRLKRQYYGEKYKVFFCGRSKI